MSRASATAKLFYEVYRVKPDTISSAPARLDFLNTHQDYKGLPVVSVGVDLRTYIAFSKRDNSNALVVSYNLLKEGVDYRDEFDTIDPVLREGKWFGNYLRAGVVALKDYGYHIGGFQALIDSDVPVAAGMASSAALLVSFIHGLSTLFNLGLGTKDVAEIAYHAEHDVMGIPCGRLDQYGSAYGGILEINTRPPYNVEQLPSINGVFIVIDSCIRHSTADIHPRRQEEIDRGLQALLELDLPSSLRDKLGKHYWEPKWDQISEEELRPYLGSIPEVSRKRILFTLRMNESTKVALKAIRGQKVSVEELYKALKGVDPRNIADAVRDHDVLGIVGLVMNYQHMLLRDYYDVSLPVLDNIASILIDHGCLGAKLSGAGLGGSVICLTRKDVDTKKILEAGLDAGGCRGWIVNIDRGVKTEYL